MKFGTLQQMLNPTAVTWPKIEIFKIQDGGRPPFLKSLNRHYLSEQSSDFNEIWYTTSDIEPDYGHVTKNWFSKFEMATAAILKIVFFGHNSLTDCPISAKFSTRKQNGMPRKAAWQKLQIFKIQDGGRPPLLNRHISVKLLLDFDKIWCTTAYIEPDDVYRSAVAVS